jgi:hypothetical protein
MKTVKSILLFLFFVLTSVLANAQDEVQMADQMRSNGRIYVVVAVMVALLLGFLLYLVRVDRKVSKLERTYKS